MRQGVYAVIFVLAWVTVCEARSARVQWPLYQHAPDAPATSLILYRSVNSGPFRKVREFKDVTRTTYKDDDIRRLRHYCYRLRARTATGALSDFSEQGCAQATQARR